MMMSNDAVVMQQFCVLMTHFLFCPPKMMDTVTTHAWEFSQTLNQIILRGCRAHYNISKMQGHFVRSKTKMTEPTH